MRHRAGRRPSALVVGAGVFGTALADRLVALDWDVTLVDRFEPGDPRSESGGETRLIRFSHGPDARYARSAWRARQLWRELGGGVLVETGLAWFVRRDGAWEAHGERILRDEGIAVERLSPGEAERLFPSLATGDLEFVLLEPDAGVLRARAGVRALAARALAGGLRMVRGKAQPDGEGVVVDARRLAADHVIWACGAWLAALFPDHVKLRVTRQDVVLFDAPTAWAATPGWVDFDSSFYGHGLVEPHGLKVGSDRDGEPVDPDRTRLRRPREPPRGSTSAGASPRSPSLPSAPRRCATTR